MTTNGTVMRPPNSSDDRTAAAPAFRSGIVDAVIEVAAGHSRHHVCPQAVGTIHSLLSVCCWLADLRVMSTPPVREGRH
jgi:hypothetical protein